MLLSVVIRKGHVTFALGAVISVFLSRCSYPKACSGIREVSAEKATGTPNRFLCFRYFLSLFSFCYIFYCLFDTSVEFYGPGERSPEKDCC